MAYSQSRIPRRRRANSAEPRSNYFVKKFSKLVLNGNNTENIAHPKESNVNRKSILQQPKFSNPFARFTSFSRRKKDAQVKVPPLDFTQSYTELILELAYTSNLTRQVIRPFNREHLVNQLTECARLIRGRIASGAACIQFPSSTDAENNSQRVLDNRIIMERINQFNEAHAMFTDWINKLSSAKFVNDIFGPTVIYPSGEDNHTCEHVILSESTYSIQDKDLLQDLQNDGELLFCQLQSAALTVFELLKNVGYTTLVEPSCMEASLYECRYSQKESDSTNCNKNGCYRQITDTEVLNNHSHCDSNVNASSVKKSSILTEEDRELLAKLWRYLDPTNNVFGSNSPPPKPPLPNSCPLNIAFFDRRTELTTSSINPSTSPLSLNPFDDPNLVAYLYKISCTAQHKYPSDFNSIKGNLVSLEKSSSPTSGKLNLNATDHLNFPLVDESDPSDIESSINRRNNSVEINSSPKKQSPRSKLKKISFLLTEDSSPSAADSKLKLDNGQDRKVDVDNRKSVNFTKLNQTGSDNKSLFQPSSIRKIPFHSKKCKYWSKHMSSTDSNSNNNNNPLSDSSMQEQIAKMAMHLQDNDSHSQQLGNSFIASGSSGNTTGNVMTMLTPTGTSDTTMTDTNYSVTNRFGCNKINDDGDNNDQLPVCQSEVKSDTEDVYELIESNGKKYRRYFQRHVVIERHKVREVILAPSLPDGTGPDMSRVIINRSDQVDNKPTDVYDSIEYTNELNPSVDALSLSTSSSSPSVCRKASNCTAPQQHQEYLDDSSGYAIETNENSDYTTSEEMKLATIDPEPPKPPLLNEKPLINYMFRFGSTNYDNPDDERRLSNQLIDFFRDHWLKEESAKGPHERKKVISYIQRYTQPTTSGDLIHKATCIQHTCTVRIVGGIEGLKAQADHNAGMKLSDDEVSDIASCSSLTSPSNEDKTSLLEETEVPQQQVKLSLDLSPYDDRESKITIVSQEPDDEDDISPQQLEKEIYLPPPVIETTHRVPILSLVEANEYLVWGDRNLVNDISVHAGCADALTVYMTSYGRMLPSYYLFFETFLFMYRSFMTSEELVDRLITRYQYFSKPPSHFPHLLNLSPDIRSKVCNSTVSILVTVVSRLKGELNDALLKILENFVKTLSQDGYDSLSRILQITVRRQTQEKYQLHSSANSNNVNNSVLRSNSPATHIRVPSLGDITPLESNHNYLEYDKDAGFITFPKTKPRHSQPLESFARYSLVESTGNDHSNSVVAPALTYKRLLQNSLKNGQGILNFSAKALAEQFTYLECVNYYKIEVTELLDITKLERGKAPGVAACARHFTAVSNWATYQILCLSNTSDRDKVANRLMDVMEHLYKLQNFSTYLSLLCAFLLIPDVLFSKKTRSRLSRITPYMQPPYFSKYRHDLEAANPPFIPYLGLMLQNLVVLAQGNPLYYKTPPVQLSDRYQSCHGPIINFWRCWKHFLIIHFFVKQEKMDPEKSRYSFRPDEDILRFFSNFENSLPEAELRRLANRLRRSVT
uniref:Ras-GEF domain-containing protein n=1 Tax=Trichobilharzia regenti TaxID=157069 RepID=A0AA85JWR2_TRIRE|nr:unnamed protein product [Trichobilharzia regenti]